MSSSSHIFIVLQSVLTQSTCTNHNQRIKNSLLSTNSIIYRTLLDLILTRFILCVKKGYFLSSHFEHQVALLIAVSRALLSSYNPHQKGTCQTLPIRATFL